MFRKKDKCSTIEDVVTRNTGMVIEEFLAIPDHLPYIENLDIAVAFVKDWCEAHPGERITIVGDYDADGICATSIMYWVFSKFGWKNLKLRVPKRFSEGYGLSEKIIDEISVNVIENAINEVESGLIITVDNGIAALPAIKKAKEKGFAVVVTDHHLAPVDDNGKVILPPADVIVDPSIDKTSEFHDFCGAAVAYYFAKAMYPTFRFKELEALAAIATVADVMPLYGFNRSLVINGLEFMNNRKLVPGLTGLLNAIDAGNHLNEEDIGFKIGPCFNACGRLYDNGAEKVIRLLISKRTDPSIRMKARFLTDANEKRKEMVKESMEVALPLANDRPAVIYLPTFKEGIIGIIAGRICEELQCPAIVFTDSEKNGILKGSGRSTDEIHLKKALDSIKDDIVGYGGHAGAAGLSIRKDKFEKFIEDFKLSVGDIPEPSEDIFYDLELNPYMACCVAEELNSFSPYGQGNPQIMFHMKVDVSNGSYREIGDGSHFMIKLERPELTLMGFGLKEKYIKDGQPKKLECVGYLSLSWYNDKASPQFQIVDYKIA